MSKNTRNRILLTAVAALLLVTMAVGGTIAWLQDYTEPVTNTFTTSNIDITLDEDTTDYKMVPGNAIAKDPHVTVIDNSEACYVFVKIDKANGYDTYLEDYDVADGWTHYTGEAPDPYEASEVFYRIVPTSTKDEVFYILKGGENGVNTNGQVVVQTGVNNTQMDTAKTTAPTLTFTAYAVQQANLTVDQAWTEAQKLNTTYGKE